MAVCAIAALFSSAVPARSQVDFRTQGQADAVSAAVNASPDLVKGLAKELKSTPEQAAGAAGVIFGIAKSLLKPEDFAAMSKAVPGMDALLATAQPAGGGLSNQPAQPGLVPTPGFAASSPSTLSSPTPIAPENGVASAFLGLSKLGIKPEMIAKAVPYLSGYLKKHGGAGLSSLLGSVFKTGK